MDLPEEDDTDGGFVPIDARNRARVSLAAPANRAESAWPVVGIEWPLARFPRTCHELPLRASPPAAAHGATAHDGARDDALAREPDLPPVRDARRRRAPRDHVAAR